MNVIDVRTGERTTLHCESIDGNRLVTGRARGLTGGAFMGILLAQQGSTPKPLDVTDYVGWGTGDLIGMFDGIRNVGATAEHDSAATTWTDITGNNRNQTLVADSYAWAGDHLTSLGVGYVSTMANPVNPTTMEIVAATTSAGLCFNPRDAVGVKLLFYSGSTSTAISLQQNGGRVTVEDVTDITGFCNSDGSMYVDADAVSIGSSIGVGGFSGAGIARGNNSVSQHWAGSIYCIRLYNRALTAAEIATNYAVDRARFGLT